MDVRKVSYGTRNMSYGARKVPIGFRKVSDENFLLSNSLVQHKSCAHRMALTHKKNFEKYMKYVKSN